MTEAVTIKKKGSMVPIRIHPDNRKLFEYSNRPLVLLCATEHYGAVMNRPFEFEKYLAHAAEKKQTLTRLFLLFRELQTALNPYSTCKPESSDYIAPFPRTGEGLALDALPKYDVNERNPEFFARLHAFIARAAEYDIIVEVVLFSHSYSPEVWSLNPLNSANNVNDIEEIAWFDYTTQRHPKLFARQLSYVKDIVRELNPYDNVIYEICNEPGGDWPGDERAPSSDEVDEWLAALGKHIRQTEAALPNRHLIVGQAAFKYKLAHEDVNSDDVHQFAEKAFRQMDYDAVNMHPLSSMWSNGRKYDLGRFMHGYVRLWELRDYCLSLYGEHKPLNLDEDNAASRCMDVIGWTTHRKRAWTTLMCGGHYDMIDFTINKRCESGTPESRKHLRTWIQHLSEYIHAIDLVHARPASECVKRVPEPVCPSVLAVPGQEYHVYLADARERDVPGAGRPIQGEVVLSVPEGNYELAYYHPVDGTSVTKGMVKGGGDATIKLPGFVEDVVLQLVAKGSTSDNRPQTQHKE